MSLGKLRAVEMLFRELRLLERKARPCSQSVSQWNEEWRNIWRFAENRNANHLRKMGEGRASFARDNMD